MLTFSTLISTLVLAEEVDPSKLNPIEISAIETQPKNTKPGEPVELRIQLKIAPGFHAYVEQYRLALKQPENLRLSGLQVQPTIRFDDPISHRERLGTENHAEIISLIDTTAATGGRQNLELELTYQACGKDFCLFPKKIPLKYEMRLAGGSEDVFLQALNKGWLYALLIVFFAGFLTSLTPCIFPMIPITLAILGATDHSHSRRRAFTLSVFYVLGIATTYSSLGVMAAKTGSLFGAVLGSPLVIGFVAILFILMGLSMYGLFEIQIPHFITHRLTQRHSHGHGQSRPTGYFRAYSSGLVAGIVASPCVGPVLISVLAYVAQTQNVLLGFLLLFTFALGLGQLFLVIGTYHNMWQKLPRSGPWLEQVKFLFGTIMIAMAFYYIHPVTHGPLFDGLLATGLLIFTVYFGAFRPRRQLHTKWQRSGQALLRVIFVFALILAAKAMAPTRLMNQIMGATNTPTENKNVASPDWYRFSDELLKHAQSQGRPVILDFKADWCLSCKELDVKTFTDPRVLELGKKFVWLEVDATSSSPELETLRARYQIGGLPFVALFDSHGQWHKEWTLTGFETADLFLKRMQEALAF
jgi:thiol:disulfide interchange protein DsbD